MHFCSKLIFSPRRHIDELLLVLLKMGTDGESCFHQGGETEAWPSLCKDNQDPIETNSFP